MLQKILNCSIRLLIILIVNLSSTVTNAQCNSIQSYCIPKVKTVGNYGIGLQNVKIGKTINNSSSGTGAPPNYTSYINQTVAAKAGDTVNFSVKNGNYNTTKALLFIDYNNDGSFALNTTERLWESTNTTANAVVSSSFILPSNISPGAYRIRVTGESGSNPTNDPCKLNYGEAEDYTLIITTTTKDAVTIDRTEPTIFTAGNNTVKFMIGNLFDSAITQIDIGLQLDNDSAKTENISGLNIISGAIDTLAFTSTLAITDTGSHILKIWHNNVNGGGTVNANNDTICVSFRIICNSALSGNYTIDPAGSGATNYVSFNEAVSALICCGVSGPVMFNVSADTFIEQVQIPGISGASYSNTITFKGVSTSKTNLIYSGTYYSPYTLRLNASSYINFRNMAIKSTSTDNSFIVHYLNSKKCILSNCLIEFTSSTAQTSSSTNLACVVVSGDTSSINYYATAAGYTDSLIFDSNTIKYGYYNTYIKLGGGVSNPFFRMKGNSLTNAYNSSLYIGSCELHKIIDSNSFSLRKGTSNQFAIFSFATPPSDTTLFAEITNNLFTSLSGTGICINGSGGSYTHKGLIANNIFQGNVRGVTKFLTQYSSGSTDNWAVYHNTFYMGTGSYYTVAVDIGGKQGSSIPIKNNIFYNADKNSNNLGLFNYNNSAGMVDYNVYYTANPNSDVAMIENKYYTSKNIIGAHPNGGGIHSFYRNVNFNSATDYHHSIACLTGDTGLGVLFDYDHKTRTNPPNIGALEPKAGNKIDIGIFQITSPSGIIPIGTKSVEAIIKNYGTDSLASAKVYFKCKNILDSQVFNFSPALYVCDTATILFNNSISVAYGSYTLKVFTAASKDAFTPNDTAIFTFCAALNGQYTINSSLPASSSNFVTFSDAANQLNCGGITGAVVFKVSPHTYKEQITVGDIIGVTSTNTIEFIGTHVDSSILTYKADSFLNKCTFRLIGSRYISIKNMTIRASDSTNAWALGMMDTWFCKIKFNKIECTGKAATSLSKNACGVVLCLYLGSYGITGQNFNNEIDSNSIIGGYYGIADATSSGYHTYIRSNKITNSYQAAIYCTGLHALRIMNNVIENRANKDSSIGIHIYRTAPDAYGYHDEIVGNDINNVGQYGICIYQSGNYYQIQGQLYNNMIGGTFYSKQDIAGIYMDVSDNWNVYNNSISIANTQAASNSGIYYSGDNVNGCSFKNNSIAINALSATKAVCMNLQNTNSSYKVDYNNYYNASSNNLLNILGTYKNKNNYKSAYPNGGGVNSIDGNPSYLSKNDLHVAGSQLSAKGDTTVRVWNGDTSIRILYDIDGEKRDTNTIDIGADMNHYTSKHDLALINIYSPQSGACLGSFNQDITVIIRNTGLDSISLANDTVEVYAEVTNPLNKKTLYGPSYITGKTIYSGSTEKITITSTFDMSDSGTYIIRPYFTWAGDSNKWNNELIKKQQYTSQAPALKMALTKMKHCNGDTIIIDVSASKNVTGYKWFVNGKYIANKKDSIYIASALGSYFCVLTNSSSCQTFSDTVVVSKNMPNSNFTASKTTFCKGDSVLLGTTFNPLYKYEWMLNNTTISGANDSMYYAKDSGTYTLRVTDTVLGCSAVSTGQTLSLYSNPIANISFKGSGIACDGDSIKLIINASSGLTYKWFLNNSIIYGATDSIYSAKISGDYTMEATNANGCKLTSAKVTLWFDTIPNSNIKSNGKNNICQGDTIYLDAAINAKYSYEWYNNNIKINGATSSQLIVTTQGSYSLKITNSNGCTSTSSSNINISFYTTANPLVSASGKTTFCDGDSVSLTATNASSGIQSLDWTMNNSSLGNSSNPLLVKTSGAYRAYLKDTNGCRANTADININANPLPVPTITEIKAANELSTSSYTFYQWYLNGNILFGDTTQKIKISANGDYTVEVTDINGCKGISKVNAVNWYSGISTINNNAILNVYPNPSHHIFNLELPTGLDIKNLTVYDITGKQILVNLYHESNKNTCAIDMSSQASGIYMLQIHNNSNVYQVRLIKF